MAESVSRQPRLHRCLIPCLSCGTAFILRYEHWTPLERLAPIERLCDDCYAIYLQQAFN